MLDIELSARPQGAAVDSDGREVRGTFLLDSVICDVHWTSFEVGILACLLNAKQNTAAIRSLKPWQRILVDHNMCAQLGLLYAADLGIAERTSVELQQFYRDVSDAKAELTPIVLGDLAGLSGGARQLATVSKRWRLLAQQAMGCLVMLEPFTPGEFNDIYNRNGRILAEFLKEIVTGHCNRVNEFGEISLPSLAQRRRSPRTILNLACDIIDGDRIVPATVRDASKDGIGVVCASPPQVGRKVTIDIDGVRKLDATVIWCSGNRSGLQLQRRLESGDPLLA